MSLPNSADFALIKIKTADGPPAVYTLMCGIENVTINRSAQTSESYRRDCATPNRPGKRKLRVTGTSWSISGTGSDNIDIETEYTDAFGVSKDYDIELYADDGTDAGSLLGTYAGTGILTTRNQSMDGNNPGGADITIEGVDDLTWTAA